MTKADIRLQIPAAKQTESLHPQQQSFTEQTLTERKAEQKFTDQFHPVISAYFTALNAGNYEAAADLFAAEGVLLPPFEAAIVGPEAILRYLAAEAKGMTALPQSEIQELQEDDTDVQVIGQVQTSLFSVNVSWQFVLNAEAKIARLKIKLLASLKDLLHLKP